MTTVPPKRSLSHFHNPVFPESFPDPFLLRFGQYYYGYCTGSSSSEYLFDVIRSDDLINWERIGGAMQPLESRPPYYWAPEVSYCNGKFYLYFSSGNETLMEVRVAVSDRPDGGFIDSGNRLTKEDFAIDAHVFIDDDGQKYLFYATDFLGHTHIGTGTVVDRMVDWFKLEGDPKPVTRAAFDWQVYDPHRIEKGGVRWHTVEGPTVRKYKKRYFQMFSGGNWKNDTYGVGFATSDAVLNSNEWLQSIDGETILPVMRTIPGKLLGPGHNSAVTGPNARELFCVYHSWVGDYRVMSIDRMDFVSERLFVGRPSTETQPVPFRPSLSLDSIAGEFVVQGWISSDGSLKSLNDRNRSVRLGRFETCFLLKLSVKSLGRKGVISIRTEYGETSTIMSIHGEAGQVSLTSSGREQSIAIPKTVELHEFQSFSVEVNAPRVHVNVNDRLSIESTGTAEEYFDIFLETAGGSFEINDLLITEGFVDRFESGVSGSEGWEVQAGEAVIDIIDDEMRIKSVAAEPVIVTKGVARTAFEFAANIKGLGVKGTGSRFGFAVVGKSGGIIAGFEISGSSDDSYYIDAGGGVHFRLPSDYSPDHYRQFRFVRIGDTLQIETEDYFLGEVNVGTLPAMIGILLNGGAVGLDMARSIKIG